MTPEAERFNGWAAMLGFVAAVGAYVTTGQIIPGKRFWKTTPCSPLPLPISNTEPFFIILDSTSPMQSLFLWVAGKKSLLSKIKKIGRFSNKINSKILVYLTFLNLGVLKNIILRLKNNIEIVRAGKI